MHSPRFHISVGDLRASYGASRALHGVSFGVLTGHLLAILGRNGAGKTTTLKSINGLMRYREGSILVNGVETIRMKPERIARLGVAYCPEERGIFASLSCEENLLLPPMLNPNGLSLEEIYTLFPKLQSHRNTQGTKLSGGEQQMLAIARILRTGARILLLDEPTEGLAPLIVDQLFDLISSLKSRGYTIILVEQSFQFALNLADKLLVLESGRIIADLDGNTARNDPALVQSKITV